jgi:hypothetical protein
VGLHRDLEEAFSEAMKMQPVVLQLEVDGSKEKQPMTPEAAAALGKLIPALQAVLEAAKEWDAAMGTADTPGEDRHR